MSKSILIDDELFLLENKRIDRTIIRDFIEDCNDLPQIEEGYQEEFLESEVNNKFEKYRNYCQLFSKDVFEISDSEIRFCSAFTAFSEYKLLIELHQTKCSEKKLDDPYKEQQRLTCIQNKQKLTAIFERVVAESLVSLFNCESDYMISDKSHNNNFTIEDLCKKTNWKFLDNFTHKPIEQGDGKCDIVFWANFFDEFPGEIILLVQCKSGTNWNNGIGVQLSVWKSKINFLTKPIVCYAISDRLTTRDAHANTMPSHGLILDRIRLISLLSRHNNNHIKVIREQIEECLREIH